MSARSIAALLATAVALAAFGTRRSACAAEHAASDDKKPERKMERKPAEPVKPEGAAPALPKPAPELAQLKWFAGTWRCQGDVPASPMGPARKSRSTVTVRSDLGGLWYSGVVREDKTPDHPNPMSGMFHETYDTGKKQFLVFWFDSYGGWATQTSRGWDGEQMVFEGDGALGGQTMRVRDTFVKKGERELSHKAEMRMDGRWTTANDEVCRKVAPGPARQQLGTSDSRTNGHGICSSSLCRRCSMPEQTTRTIIVRAPVGEVFAAWADFESFPRFMKHVRSITPTGERTTRWKAEGPMGKEIEWEAETTRLEPNKRIAWRSTQDSAVRTSGQVTFNELAPDEAEVTVTLQYVPPGGLAGETAARLLSDPEEMLEEDLRNFKAYVENRVPADVID